MSNTITELPVERNDIGYWSHPAFDALVTVKVSRPVNLMHGCR
jgi:hypothetical protein